MEIQVRYAIAPAAVADCPTQWEWQEITLPWEPVGRDEFYHWERASQWDRWLVEILRLPRTLVIADATAELVSPDDSWEGYSRRRLQDEMGFWEFYCDSNMM